MNAVYQYAQSFVAGILISGILLTLSEKTCFKRQMKVYCGVFLVIMFLRPFLKYEYHELPSLSDWYDDTSSEYGNYIFFDSLSGIIKEQTEAYILSKAREVGAEIKTEIQLDSSSPPKPCAVQISGFFDAVQETELSRILVQDLGIQKENQLWIRQNYPRSGSS